MRRLGAILGLLAVSPAMADPPPRPPEQRQAVIELAYVLGESHALHRACAGQQDDTWRARMSRLVQAEGADGAYKQQLTDSFNAGFVARHAEFPACTTKSQAAERIAAGHGRRLARRLSTP
jgi:uncharacterized protein (TIGR02301 family)